MTAMFAIKKNDLKDLNGEEATALFRGLLWCEARRVGLSPHNVVISLDTNVADGGVDARITADLNADSLLVKGTTHLQLKAGRRFKPWQLSALKKELFGRSKATPEKKTLAPEIRECLKKKGRYVLVTFGYDLTPAQQSAAKKQLAKLLRACGYRAANVDVFGQGQIVGQLSQFLSLSLAFQNMSELAFLTVEEWKSRADMTLPLQLSEQQSALINTIRHEIRGTKFKHIRLIGEPGLGKTRLALEAITAEDIAPQVLYVPHAEDFQRSQLFNNLMRQGNYENVLLVIDECSEKDRASIWNALRERKKVQLLTIDHGPEQSRDELMLILDLPRLPDEQISSILATYLPSNVDSSHWVAWCEGSPRVAHAVGENLRSNPDDLLKPPATVPLWDRFIAGYESLNNQISQESLTVLRHLALFTKFGFEDPVTNEARFICQIVQRVNPAITWERFQELVNRLRRRRILQGKRTLFIVPKALHIHLWINYWDNYGRDFSFVDFFSRIPSQLQNWFLQSFIYAHASPVAMDVVARILSPDGPFSDRTFLTGQAGTRFINYLSEAYPARTLAFMERTFDTWTKDDLLSFRDGRQDIVWALEKIAVWKEHFPRAARMLVKLALAENSKFGNNSTGILRGLFATRPGLGGTQAPPVDRFPIIEELLQSPNDEEVGLGLSLCEEWLNTRGGIRIVGAEYQGLRPELEFWKPKTWGELFDAWRHCWRHLWSVSRDWPSLRRQRANRVLIDEGLELVNTRNLSAEVMESLSRLADDEATDRRHLTHALIGKLRYRTEKLPKGVVSGLRALDQKLTGKSFWGRFSRFVLNTNWDEDYNIKGGAVRELTAPLVRVKEIVGEVVRDPTLLITYLPQIVREQGHRLLEFGRHLAVDLNADSTVREIISAQLAADVSKNTQFIGGYFTGLRATDAERWEKLVQELLGSGDTRALGISVALYSGRSEPILQTLLQVFRSATVDASVFNGLAWEAVRVGFPPEVIHEIFEALVTDNTAQSLNIAIELADNYFFDKDHPRTCDELLLFRLITAPHFFRRDNNQHDHYAWFEVVKGFRQRFPHRDLELFKVIIVSENELGLRHSNYPPQIADAIARDHPDDAWAIISENLESDEEHSTWLEMWLGEEVSFDDDKVIGPITVFNPQSVMAWVEENPTKRRPKIRRCLPKTLDEAQGGKLSQLFIEAFGEGDSGNSLMSHFWVGGWSGPESAHLARKRDAAREWVSKIKSGKILAWLYRYIEVLNELIAQAEMREERGF